MKRALVTFGQFVVFLAVFAIGSFLHPWNMHWAEKSAPTGVTTYFIPDGLLLAIGLFIAVVVIQAMRRRTCDTPWTVIGFLVAVAAGYAIRLGFITRDF